MSNFEHFTITQDDVTARAGSLSMLHPYLANIAANEAPTDEWVAIVNEADLAIPEALAGKEDSDYVTVAYPKAAVGVMIQAIGFVDRLLVILQEEIDKAIAKREDEA